MSLPGELWVAILPEGGDALGHVVRRQEAPEGLALHEQASGVARIRAAVEDALCGLQPYRRPVRDVRDHSVDLRLERVGRDRTVEEPPSVGGFGVDLVAAVDQFLGPSRADESLESLDTTGAGDEPEPDLRLSECRPLGRQPDIAGEREFAPGT
mgnify:CR=1 FL=1